jgi:hypothetical protein
MSSVALGNIFIASNATQCWVTTWNNSGWQGNTIVQPQPFNTDASMSYTDPSITVNVDGTYSFSYCVTNNGPNDTFYNLQVSSS